MRRAILLVLLSFCVLALPAGPARADYGSDRKAYDALRRANAELEKTKPEQAVTAYRTFLEAHPDLHPKIGVDLTSTTADLLYSRLKQTDKALQICDWAIETYRESRCMVESLTAKAQVLNAEKRWAEAQLLLEKEWDRVMAADQFRIGPAVQQLVAALDAQGKRKEATETTYKALSSNGDLLSWWWYQGTPPGWMYDRVLKDLVAKNRLEEALSWAKLIFMVCGSTPNEINAAMGYLDRVWNLKDLSDRTFKAFQAAARTPANPNPLDQVKLPELNLEAMNAHADRPVDTAADLAGIIGAQIATGRMREAVVTSQEWYVKCPDAFPDLIKRVLKAGFLNTKVMEEFDAFRKTGQGPNPMEDLARRIAAEGSRPAGDKTPAGGDQKIRVDAAAKPGQTQAAGKAVTLGYVKDAANDKRSLTGTGFAVAFERPEDAAYLTKVRICATRTGAAAGTFHVYLLDEQMQVLADLPFPYSIISQGELRWHNLAVPPTRVPERFGIGLDFRPVATKEIHLGMNRGVEKTHSFVGLPAKGYQEMVQPVEWMVRAVVSEQPARKQP